MRNNADNMYVQRTREESNFLLPPFFLSNEIRHSQSSICPLRIKDRMGLFEREFLSWLAGAFKCWTVVRWSCLCCCSDDESLCLLAFSVAKIDEWGAC